MAPRIQPGSIHYAALRELVQFYGGRVVRGTISEIIVRGGVSDPGDARHSSSAAAVRADYDVAGVETERLPPRREDWYGTGQPVPYKDPHWVKKGEE